MRLLQSSGQVRVFISSAIAEFAEHRKYIHRKFNVDRICDPYQAWVYEYAAPVPGHEEGFFLGELERSHLVALVLGEELREAVKKEYVAAKELHKDVLVFLRGHHRIKEFEAKLGYLGVKCTTWDTPEELVEVLDGALRNRISQNEALRSSAPATSPRFSPDVPPRWEASYRRLTVLCDEGSYRSAEAFLNRLSEDTVNDADKVELDNLRAFYYRRLGEYDKAESIYKELNARTKEPRFEVGLVLTHTLRGDFKAAYRLIDKLSSRANALPSYHLAKAQINYLNQAYVEGLSCLNHPVLRRNRYRFDSDFWSIRGACYAGLGRRWRAFRAFGKAVNGEVGSSVAIASQSFNLFELARAAGSVEWVRKSLALIKKARAGFRESELAQRDQSLGFQQFMVILHARILHQLGQDEEAMVIVRDAEADVMLDAVGAYSAKMLRLQICGEIPARDVLQGAANATNDPAIWFDLLSKDFVDCQVNVTCRGNFEQTLKAIEEKNLDPGLLRFGLGLSAIVDGRRQDAERYLIPTVEDWSVPEPRRMNAANALFVYQLNNGERNDILNCYRWIGSQSLLNFDLLGVYLEYLLNLSQRGISSTLHRDFLMLVADIVHVASLAPTRSVAVTDPVIKRLGHSLWRLARIYHEEIEVGKVIGDLGSLLAPRQNVLLLDSISTAMT